MPRTVEIKSSHTPSELRRLAASTKDANQSRRFLSVAVTCSPFCPLRSGVGD
jgi:hypothetical protein